MIRVGDDRQIEWRQGMTVADLIAEIDDDYSYAVVRVNDKVVSGPKFAVTLVPDGAQVRLLPLVAGG